MEKRREFAEKIIKENRYLTLASSDGGDPWIATLEYLTDSELNMYYFSMEESKHSVQIAGNPTVAVSIFSNTQPEYDPGKDIQLAGVQIKGEVERLKGDYPEEVENVIQLIQPPMPPYAVYRIRTVELWIPLIENGLNTRVKV